MFLVLAVGPAPRKHSEMADQIVPLVAAPNQSLSTTVSVDGKSITLRLDINYNEVAGYWVMRVNDTLGNVLIDSVPLLTGEYPAANLLAQSAYLGIGSAYVLNVSNTSKMDYPDNTNLGTDFQLLWSDTPKS